MKRSSGFEIKYAGKASEAPTSVIESLNKNFGIIFECSNGKIMNITREHENEIRRTKQWRSQ